MSDNTIRTDKLQTGTYHTVRDKLPYHDIFSDALKLIGSKDFKTRAVGIRLAVFESRHKKDLPQFIEQIQFDANKEVMLMIFNSYENGVEWTILETLMKLYNSPVIRNDDSRTFPSFLFVLNNLDLKTPNLFYKLGVINEILSHDSAPRTIIFLVKSEDMQNESENNQIVEKLSSTITSKAVVTARTDLALKHLFAGDTKPMSAEANEQ